MHALRSDGTGPGEQQERHPARLRAGAHTLRQHGECMWRESQEEVRTLSDVWCQSVEGSNDVQSGGVTDPVVSFEVLLNIMCHHCSVCVCVCCAAKHFSDFMELFFCAFYFAITPGLLF